jgi:hypothetical protein
MTTRELLNIALALPKCIIEKPNNAGCQFILDSKGNRVGHIHWQLNEIAIYTDYEYCDQVIESMEKEIGVEFIRTTEHDSDAYCDDLIKQIKQSDNWME